MCLLHPVVADLIFLCGRRLLHVPSFSDGGLTPAGAPVVVRPAMDDGPIILQAAIPTLPQDTPETLANRVLQQEHIIFPLAVRMIAEGRVKVEGNVVKIEGASFHSTPIINPFD